MGSILGSTYLRKLPNRTPPNNKPLRTLPRNRALDRQERTSERAHRAVSFPEDRAAVGNLKSYPSMDLWTYDM